MPFLWIFLALLAIALGILIYCFRQAFYVSKRENIGPNDYPIPIGRIYEPYRDQMKAWMDEMRALPRQEFTVRSHDGLTLHGLYFVCDPDAPIELMFHGYRGNAERDLCGGVQRCFALGHNAFIVDQRGAGKSQGRVISFGANEKKDCHAWLELIGKTFPNNPVILTGISMGAATVLLAAGQELPKQVVAVLADCGYSSAEAIIKDVIRGMKLPPKLAYPFVALSARLFGGFSLKEANVTEAVKHCTVPVIFYHGEDDDFVPCQMSVDNFNACPTHKKLVTTPGAGHGLCYLVDPEGYLQAAREFFGPILPQ